MPKHSVIFVERAEHLRDFSIRLIFNDGTERIVDFGSFLCQSHKPLIPAYLDPAAFARFVVRDGDLIWDDYDMCFPIADIYEGRV